MVKTKRILIILSLIIFLNILSSNTVNLSILQAQGAFTPTREVDIVIGIDIGHLNNFTTKQITNLTNILNSTFSTQKIVFIKGELTENTLRNLDVVIILAPTKKYTEAEINNVEEYIKNGNSLLVASGFRNQTTEPINDLLEPFGLVFNLSSSLIPEKYRTSSLNATPQYFYLAQNFTSPVTPITENISQIIVPNGMGISSNKTKIEEYKSPDIIFNNPILLRNSEDSVSENNTLASTLEFENGARILAIGSTQFCNNSYIEPISNTTLLFLDNTDFILNSIRWLGRNQGIMSFYNSWVDLDDASISIGVIIKGNVTLVDTKNQSISQSKVFIALERDGKILKSRAMQLDPVNKSNYFGWISTEGLSYGHCNVLFLASRVGYLSIEISAGRNYLKRPFPFPIPPDLAVWGLFLATVVLFITTAFFLRMNIRKGE